MTFYNRVVDNYENMSIEYDHLSCPLKMDVTPFLADNGITALSVITPENAGFTAGIVEAHLLR